MKNQRIRFPRLKEYVLRNYFEESTWEKIESEVELDVQAALKRALSRAEPDQKNIKKYLFYEPNEPQMMGGAVNSNDSRRQIEEPQQQKDLTRINMLTAIRRTLEYELKVNDKVVVFGEDVGPKGGVHGATLGLQEMFGHDRVFDTSLSEEGIIGRAVGMAYAGLMPVPEIQFRKYADPATEHLNNCGTIRWRTNNRFAAPIVVRIPGGFAKCGDPWHSVSGEVMWAHTPGWQVAMPSNAADAVGLLRTALRSQNPTIFFEHRHLLDTASARRPYPGDAFLLPFGEAKVLRSGKQITVVTWGAMVERCEEAVKQGSYDVELIDLRTISPWDKESVITSVKKTRRCLIVHEDGMTAGFGAEIVATIAREAFFNLDAPVLRVAVEDIPTPYNVSLMDAVIPTVLNIFKAIKETCNI